MRPVSSQTVPQFQLNIGLNPGYNHDNDVEFTLAWVARQWDRVAEEVRTETGIYVAAVVQPARTQYYSGYGCPRGGEETVVFTGLFNPHHRPDLDPAAWKNAVRAVCEALRKEFKQTTAYLTFTDVAFEYLRD